MNNGSALELVAAPSPIKLDLACGQNCKEGFEGVDLLASGAKHRLDLLTFPWPWADSSVDELHSSHFIEHIPMRETEGGKDLFFAFFDECWRILKPGGTMQVVCPSARSNRAFQDPTHRRFIVQETFLYLSAEWRKLQKLDHYRVDCDFAVVSCVGSTDIGEQAYNAEVQGRRFNHYWNVTLDWYAVLKSLKK